MPMTQILQHLGLSDKEARVYISALELGSAPVQLIAIKAKINRPTAYVVIDNLLKLGLMTRHESGKKTFFAAEAPERLERLIERQHELLAEKEAELKSNFPELKALFNLAENKPRIKFYEGREGHLSMDQEYYKKEFRGKTLYAIAPLDILEEAYGPDHLTTLVNKRVELNINLKVIYTSRKSSGPILSDPGRLRETRYVPMEKFPFQGELSILPEWGFWMYSYKKGFIGIAVESPELGQTLKSVFDLAWEAASLYQQIKKPATRSQVKGHSKVK